MNREQLDKVMFEQYNSEQLYVGVLINTNMGEIIFRNDGRFSWLEDVDGGTLFTPVMMNNIDIKLL